MLEQQETKANKIDRSTVLPLSLFLGAIIMSATAAMAWGDLNNGIDHIVEKLDRQWTKDDQMNYALRTKLRNPSLRVVDPADPSKELTINN